MLSLVHYKINSCMWLLKIASSVAYWFILCLIRYRRWPRLLIYPFLSFPSFLSVLLISASSPFSPSFPFCLFHPSSRIRIVSELNANDMYKTRDTLNSNGTTGCFNSLYLYTYVLTYLTGVDHWWLSLYMHALTVCVCCLYNIMDSMSRNKCYSIHLSPSIHLHMYIMCSR